MPTLSVVDNGSGSATITVSGNTGTATVYLSRFLGTNASRSFTVAGTVVGNGTLVLTGQDTGAYIAVATNTEPSVSAPVFFRLADSSESLHMRCLEAVREYIMSLSIPSVQVAADAHYIVKLPYRPDLEFDLDSTQEFGIFYFPLPESYTAVDNEFDTVAYSVQVVLIRKIGKKLQEGLSDLLKCRELAALSMSICPLPDVPEVHTVDVLPGAVVMPERWQNSYDASSVVFRCISEQPTGID